jgi:hypothetical protein
MTEGDRNEKGPNGPDEARFWVNYCGALRARLAVAQLELGPDAAASELQVRLIGVIRSSRGIGP